MSNFCSLPLALLQLPPADAAEAEVDTDEAVVDQAGPEPDAFGAEAEVFSFVLFVTVLGVYISFSYHFGFRW